MNFLRFPLFLVGCLALCLVSCDDDDDDATPSDSKTTSKQEVKEAYANLVFANYEDSYNEAVKLQTAVNAFLAAPSEASLQAAKDAWLAAREPYGQTEAFRFAGGPIDDEDGPEGALNAWPLDESYIDYTDNNGTVLQGGIINDVSSYPTLTKELLASLNEQGGEENVSIGYHAIEFLLWGQDLGNPSVKKAGERPYTDFVVDGGTAQNQDRRREYLKIVTDLLLEDLNSVKQEWNPSSGAYRAKFLASDDDQALTEMLTGIGVLAKSELAGERIFTAYDNKDQEDEHSCFSDNTHRDTRLNAIGVQNVYLGTYTRVDGSKVSGKSLHDLLSEVDATLASDVNSQLQAATSAVDATAIPFDFAISDDSTRPNILTAVQELRTLGDKFAEAGQKLGLIINTALPE